MEIRAFQDMRSQISRSALTGNLCGTWYTLMAAEVIHRQIQVVWEVMRNGTQT